MGSRKLAPVQPVGDEKRGAAVGQCEFQLSKNVLFDLSHCDLMECPILFKSPRGLQAFSASWQNHTF